MGFGHDVLLNQEIIRNLGSCFILMIIGGFKIRLNYNCNFIVIFLVLEKLNKNNETNVLSNIKKLKSQV